MKKIRAHLGCWTRFIPGFIHVDLCDFPHIDYRSSIDKLTFFPDNSVSLIYCSHAFEYFSRDDAPRVLKEWFRVLCPGGTLRLAVPNFPALIRIYEETGKIEAILGPIYGKMKVDTQYHQAVELYHKTCYDETSLVSLLNENGFREARWWDWRLTEHSAVDDHSQAYFPHMQKDTGVHVSLNIEAMK